MSGVKKIDKTKYLAERTQKNYVFQQHLISSLVGWS